MEASYAWVGSHARKNAMAHLWTSVCDCKMKVVPIMCKCLFVTRALVKMVYACYTSARLYTIAQDKWVWLGICGTH